MQDQAKQTVLFFIFFRDYPYKEEAWRLIVAGTCWLSFSALGKYWRCDNRPAWAEEAVTSALIRLGIFMLSLPLITLSWDHPDEHFTKNKYLQQVNWTEEFTSTQIQVGNHSDRWHWQQFLILLSLSASRLCCGGDSSPQISSSLKADNKPVWVVLVTRWSCPHHTHMQSPSS